MADLPKPSDLLKKGLPKPQDLLEKKNPIQNGQKTGSQPLFSGSKPFQTQVPTEVPSVLTEQGKVGYEQEVQKKAQQKQKLSEQLKSAKSAFVTAQGEDVARDIEMYQQDPESFRQVESNSWLGNAIKQGLLTGELANSLPTAGPASTPEELSRIADINYQIERIPQSEAQKEYQKSGLKVFKNPLLGAQFLTETLASSFAGLYESAKRTVPLATTAGAGLGAFAGGIGALPGAGLGVMGGLSVAGLNLSTSGDIIQSLRDSGVDVTDKDALIKAFSDKNKMSEIRTNALKYGVPIMVVDMATAGIAGKLIGGTAGKSIAKKISAGLGEAGIQAVGGSTGELSGQYLSGKKIDWNDVAIEGIASLATDAPDVAIGAMTRDKSSSSNKNIVAQINKFGLEEGVKDAKINLDRDLVNGDITKEDYQQGIEFIGKAVEANNKIPVGIEGESREKSIELIANKNDILSDIETLNKQKEDVDDSFYPAIDEQIKAKESEIKILNKDIQELAKTPTKPITAQPLQEDLVITPETSSNYANMTEDDKGNFVFFHVGNKGYETIKPGTGASTVTSREEAAALSKVGGLGMYYTNPNQEERQSAEGAKYAVKIPKEKVYDFNTDKLNFIEEAEARHETENPGKAFDINSQLAYVTKIAGEKGFDMVVAQWNNMTRAQTTKELTPTDIQELEGNVIKKDFNEKYESNKQKGFEPVVPVAKSEKLATLYDKINKIRNKEKRYDDLYRLYADSNKLEQDDITNLIDESDLPQEIKDEYKEILESKEETRRSQQTKPKEDGKSEKVVSLKESSTYAKGNKIGDEKVSFDVVVDGNEIGNVILSKKDNKYYVHVVEINDSEKGKGYAGEAYKMIGKKLSKEGYGFTSARASSMESEAIRVWEKLVNSGFAVKNKDNSFTYKEIKPTQDAVQKQAAGQVPVQSRAKVGEEVVQGEPEAELKGVTEEGGKEVIIDKTSSNAGIKPKNLRDLYNINRKIFSQDRIKSLASAIVMDRMIGAMAKRAGVSKDKIYNRIYFKKATPGEIKSIENNSSVLFQANYSDDKTGITFSYDKNTDNFNKLKESGYITEDKNINDFSGQYIIFHKPDYAFSGDIIKNGNVIVEGQGGIYYPIKFHKDGLVWAASSERAAKAFAKRLNESAKLSPDGKVRLALVSSPNEKVLSSYNAAAGIVDVLSSKVFDEKFGLKEDNIKSALIESSNAELGTDIANDTSLKEVVSIIKEKLSPENIGSIDKRRNFTSFGKNSLLSKIAENIKDTKNIEDLISFFGDGIANKEFVGKRTGKLSKSNLVQAFSYMFNEPMLRDIKDSDLTYAVIEVPASKDGGDVVTYEKNESHKSYPYSIVIKDKSAKTTLNILSETSKWNESAIDPLTNKTVAKDRMLNLLDTMSGVSNKPLMISKPKQVDINWEVSKEGKGDPSISSRNPIVEESAKNLKEGKITNEEYRATVSENSPIGPITRFFAPATDQQIKKAFEVSTKKDTEAELINEPLTDGEKVGLRLDIPSYKFNNTWVVSVHDGDSKSGKIKSYRNVAKIKNVEFGTVPKAGLNIASGDVAKTTIARMFGDWVEYEGKNSTEKAKNAKDEIESIANDKNWVQVGMNPFRHSYFYDRSSDIGRPILGANEVVQIGGLVYAKNPQYGNWTDDAFAVRDSFDSAGNEIRFQDKMGAIITQDSNSIIYALTDPNVSTPLHEMAHAFEHYLTLDERKDVLGWANTNTWTKETSEKFARGFEKYLSEGKAPTPTLQKIFNKFKDWLTDIYNGIVDSEIDIELNEKMRSIYSSMLGEDKAGSKLNESNIETAIDLLDDINENKRKAERASSKRKAELESKIAEDTKELDNIPEATALVRSINDNFDAIKKELKEKGLLKIKC
jgi:hypothetical protein